MHFLIFLGLALAVVAFSIFGRNTDERPPAGSPRFGEAGSPRFGEAGGFSSPTLIVSQAPSPKASPLPSPVLKSKVLLEVPFVAQAPTGNWTDPRQQDGCEEAAAFMAVLWAKGERPPSSLQEQEKMIYKMALWQEAEYGSYHDTAVEDTVERIYKAYFGFDKVRVVRDIEVINIKQELSAGNLVQVPADGRVLANPNYTAPGPERHNLIIIGYDDATGEFITNDNGTRKGKGYRYKYEVMMEAIRDYPTGDRLPSKESKKVMIIIKK